MKPLNQKTKDRLTVIAILALEAVFIFGAASNFYRYIYLKISLDIYLAVPSTIGAAILMVFIVIIIVSFLDKRKFLKKSQNKQKIENRSS